MSAPPDAWLVPHEEPFRLAAAFYGPGRPLRTALAEVVELTAGARRSSWVVQVDDPVSLPDLVSALREAEGPDLLVCAADAAWRRAQGALAPSDLRAALHEVGSPALVEGSARAAVVGTLELARPGDGLAVIAPARRRDATLHHLVDALERREAFAPPLDPA
jgi:hypothetical protein